MMKFREPKETSFLKMQVLGEGCHLYKVKGKYFITRAWYAGEMRLAVARADHIVRSIPTEPCHQ
jgi:hypothetical protein